MTPEELDNSAFHVAFEVVTLVAQLECYMDAHSPIFPSSSSSSPTEEALLEASLVHLRLLDEFLASKGRFADDVKASDWPGSSGSGFLDKSIQEQINAHVAHLSRRRVMGQEWYLAELGKIACERILEFLDSIPTERLPAFAPAAEVAQRGLSRFENELVNWPSATREGSE